MGDLLCLAYFTEHNTFKVFHIVAGDKTLFLVPRAERPRFVHVFVCWWTLGFSPFGRCESSCTSICLTPCFKLFWTHAPKWSCWVMWSLIHV